MMQDVLIYGDTVRCAELRHELPLLVPDPFLYLETGGARHVVVSTLERPRIAALDGQLKLHLLEEFGLDELLDRGAGYIEASLEISVRACQELGVKDAVVPGEFPLELADRLRAAGVSVVSDRERFAERRRVKSDAEFAGIRRAQAAAEAGMTAAARLLRSAEVAEEGLLSGGEPLTCELIKDVIRDAVGRGGGNIAEDLIVSHGPQTAVGHDLGSGRIRPNEPVIIDLWPRDPESACHADMTRTFVVGEAPEELRRYHTLTLDALERARDAVRAGVAGKELHGLACVPYDDAGIPTDLTKAPGQVLEEGFFHALGHGVGLEVHEAPILGRSTDVLVAGDVITLEPGTYRPGFGGCRLEDLVLVTEDGSETLTDFPYELEP
jgi:Xaa-Pro aminopeptidase